MPPRPTAENWKPSPTATIRHRFVSASAHNLTQSPGAHHASFINQQRRTRRQLKLLGRVPIRVGVFKLELGDIVGRASRLIRTYLRGHARRSKTEHRTTLRRKRVDRSLERSRLTGSLRTDDGHELPIACGDRCRRELTVGQLSHSELRNLLRTAQPAASSDQPNGHAGTARPHRSPTQHNQFFLKRLDPFGGGFQRAAIFGDRGPQAGRNPPQSEEQGQSSANNPLLQERSSLDAHVCPEMTRIDVSAIDCLQFHAMGYVRIDLGPTRPIRPQPGGSSALDSVVGRDEICLDLFQSADAGLDQLLADPRRMGKTSAMKRLSVLLPENWDVAFTDFQGIVTVSAFVARAFEEINARAALSKRAVDAVKGFFTDATLSAGKDGIVSLSKTFEADALATFEKAVLALDEKLVEEHRNLLLCWDEIPDAVEQLAANEGNHVATAFLQTFRRIRQRTTAIRWLVAGSVGFHHIRAQIGADVDVINDMMTVPFGPLDANASRWLAESLLLYFVDKPDPSAIDRLSDRSGGIPYLLHAIAHHVYQRRPDAVSPDEVDQAFVEFIIDTDRSQPVTHFLARIDDYYGDKAGLARSVLDLLQPTTEISFATIAGHLSAAEADRDELTGILDLLKLDHYVAESTDHEFSWRYQVLGEIWHYRRRNSATA